MQGPEKQRVEQKLFDLITGRCTREEAAQWANRYIEADATMDDQATWRALVSLAGADLPTTDREFLHGEADFCIWLETLKRSKRSL